MSSDNTPGRELEPTLSQALAATEPTKILNTGVPFDLAKIEERQGEIDEILESPRSPEEHAKELNKRIADKWNDDFGISFLYISGVELPGLKINGVAEGLVLTGDHLPGADFRGAHMRTSVLTGSTLPGLQAQGADLDASIFTLTSLPGADLRDVTAIDTIFNFADITNLQAAGADLTSSYLIGVRGLTPRIVEQIALLRAARYLIPKDQEEEQPTTVLQNTLAAGYSTGVDGVLQDLDAVKIIRNENMAGKLLAQGNLEGVIFDDVTLSRTRMAGQSLVGSVFHNLHAGGVNLRGAKLSGVFALNSYLQSADLNRAWVPGMLMAGGSLRKAQIPGGNVAGAVFLNVDMENMDTDGTSFDGTIIIGGTPPDIEENMGKRLRIVRDLSQLPKPVAANIQNLGGFSLAGPTGSTKQLKR